MRKYLPERVYYHRDQVAMRNTLSVASILQLGIMKLFPGDKIADHVVIMITRTRKALE